MCRECFNDESLVKEMRESQLLGDDEGLKRKPLEVKPSQDDLMKINDGGHQAVESQASTKSIFT